MIANWHYKGQTAWLFQSAFPVACDCWYHEGHHEQKSFSAKSWSCSMKYSRNHHLDCKTDKRSTIHSVTTYNVTDTNVMRPSFVVVSQDSWRVKTKNPTALLWMFHAKLGSNKIQNSPMIGREVINNDTIRDKWKHRQTCSQLYQICASLQVPAQPSKFDVAI